MSIRRGKIYVPMPEAGSYNEGVRDKMVSKYGEASVTRAETAVLINLMIAVGVIKQSEFIGYMVEILEKTEENRKRAAGIRD
jgi:hypothetical protein